MGTSFKDIDNILNKANWSPEFVWRFWRVGWLANRCPRWCFFEWRWDDPVNRRWFACGPLVVKVG